MLFSEAYQLEEEGKIEDGYLLQLKANKFRKVSLIGTQAEQLRQQVQRLVFTSKGDVSTLILRLLLTIVENAGVPQFVRENLRLRQKMTRTTDDTSKFGVRHRLMVELSE